MSYPQYKNGTVIFSSDPTSFACQICPENSPTQSLDDHLQQEDHRSKFAYFSHYFYDHGPFVYCKTCKKEFSLIDVVEHAKSHNFIPWCPCEKELELLFKNFISFRNDQRYCHICHVKCLHWFSAISHTENSDHKSNLSSLITDSINEDSTFSESLYKFASKHIIFRNKNQAFYCFLCECEVGTSLGSLVKHTGGAEHVKKENEFDDNLKSAKIYELSFDNVTLNESEDRCNKELDIIVSICRVCKAEVSIDDIKAHRDFHNDVVEQKIKSEKENEKLSKGTLLTDVTLDNDEKMVIGDANWTMNDVKREHDDFLNNNATSEKKEVISALIIDNQSKNAEVLENSEQRSAQLLPDEHSAAKDADHLKSTQVSKDTNSTSISHTGQCSRTKPILPDVLVRRGAIIYCIICLKSIGTYKNIDSHFASREHTIYQDAITRGISRISDKQNICNYCNCTLVGYHTVQAHVSSSRHARKVPQIRNEEKPKVINQTSVNPEKTSTHSRPKQVHINTSVFNARNNISKNSTTAVEVTFIKCTTCNWVILGGSANIARHTKSEEHVLKLQSSSPDTCNRAVTIEPMFTVCKSSMYFMLESNVESDMNMIKVLKLPLNNIDSAVETFYWCNVCDIKVADEPKIHLQSDQHLQTRHGIKRIVGSQFYTCKTCSYSRFISPGSIMDHVNGSIHQKNILIENQSLEIKASHVDYQSLRPYLPQEILPEGIERFEDIHFICIACNCRLGSLRSVERHVKDDSHIKFVKKNCVIKIRPSVFACMLCCTIIRDIRLIEEHLNDLLHQVKCKDAQKLDSVLIVNKLLKPMKTYAFNAYSCSLCNIRLEGDPVRLLEHTFGRRHQELLKAEAAMRKLNEATRKTANLPDCMVYIDGQHYFCNVCNCRIDGLISVNEHLRGNRHRQNKLQLTSPSESSNKPVIKEANTTSTSEKSQKQFTDDLTMIISKSKKPSEKRKSSKRPLDADANGEVDIYEVDKQKMEILQRGVLLTLPVDKDNLYCLICRKTSPNCARTFYEHLCSANHLDYLHLMVEDHQKFKDYPDELSDLVLAYEYMEEIDDFSVKCHACRTLLKNKTVSLNKHIREATHCKLRTSLAETAKIWFITFSSMLHCDSYSVRRYWCMICKLKCSTETDFRTHLTDKAHIANLKQFDDVKDELIFDSCAACAALWFGSLWTFGFHAKTIKHKENLKTGVYLLTKLPPLAEFLLQSPEDKVNRLVEKIDKVQAENAEKEKKLILDLETIAREEYPMSIVHPFGSRVTALGDSSSDFDVFLECNESYQHSSAIKVKEYLNDIRRRLEKHPETWVIMNEIVYARTPVVKAQHIPTKIECDISFNNGLSVESTKLVKRYCEKFPDCRRMIVFIRNWLAHCELKGHYGILSCAVSWMVIFFLQLKGILPSVAELIAQKGQSKIIGGWETGVDLDFDVVDIGEPIEKLLTGFFEFYATFDYKNEIICPLLGRSVEKRDFRETTRLPKEMKPYLEYLKSTDDPEPFRIEATLCVQDPFDLSHNVTKTARKFAVYKLRSFCLLSVRLLVNH